MDDPTTLATATEHDLVCALRNGDEQAFAGLVDAYSPMMLRLALGYVPTRAIAEEVVQDTWLALITGIHNFEERSSLKTWLFRILVNTARKRGARERRSTPFSDLVFGQDDDGPTVDPDRFTSEPAGGPAGRWTQPPQPWDSLPETRLTCHETIGFVLAAVADLPDRQRAVVVVRDVEEFTADEVCEMLGLTPGNQRVLLHRGRARIRQALEDHLDGER